MAESTGYESDFKMAVLLPEMLQIELFGIGVAYCQHFILYSTAVSLVQFLNILFGDGAH